MILPTLALPYRIVDNFAEISSNKMNLNVLFAELCTDSKNTYTDEYRETFS